VPSRWEIMLAGPQGAAIPLAAPQAVVSGWLDDPPVRGGESASGAGTRSAHAGVTRAWACGPFGAFTPDGGGPAAAVTVVQVRLLDDSLADRLQRAVRPGRPVRLGACQYQVAGPARQVSEVTWAGLRNWPGERAWQVRFVTPVCLRRGNRTSPWPAPESVARGLAERWHRLHPATAPPLPGPGAGPVWVSDIDGHSETQILTRRARSDGRREVSSEVISGFTGRIRYVCDGGTDAEAAGFGALLAFAAFAGAGSHTTYGFGVVCAEPTWQPPTVQAGQR
jgi:CRISPR-associated endoribonuclease Cas6